MAAEVAGARPPAWFAEFRRAYQSGEAHAFIMHGDVEGYAFEDVESKALLAASLAERWDVVARYHIAGGIDLYNADEALPADDARGLPAETRRERAYRAIGFRAQPQGAADAGAGGVAALLGALQPQGGPEEDPFEAAQRPAQAIGLLQELLRKGDSVAVVIDHADTLCPAPPMAGKGAMSPEDRRVLVSLLTWAKDEAIQRAGNPVFLLCRDAAELHADLRTSDSGWKAIPLPLPDRGERLAYLGWYAAMRDRLAAQDVEDGRAPRPGVALLDGLALAELANLTAGLSLRNIEDVLLASFQAGGLTRADLKAHKDAIVTASYSDVAKMIDPLPGGFDALGGAGIFKDYCRRRIVRQVREGRDQNVPRGLLLVGPPGTSKTFGVRALAGEIGFTAVALESDKILGGIVGESERKLARFLGFARSLAPCLVFVDEIDQSDLAQRGNNSGNPVAKNLFSALMQFMSDETLRGKVILVLASNRPDILDPALIRSGRIDAILPMLLPEREDRRQIAEAQARIQSVAATAGALDAIADCTEDWNAADISEVVREARLLASDEEADTIGVAHALAALDDMRPSGLDKARFFTMIALQAVNKKSLLPPKYRDALNDRAAVERQIAELKEPAPARGERRARGEREW